MNAGKFRSIITPKKKEKARVSLGNLCVLQRQAVHENMLPQSKVLRSN